MIEQIYTYFTIETLYMWVNLGVLPFWFILIVFPQSHLSRIFVTSIFPFLILGSVYVFILYKSYLTGYNFDGNFILYLGLYLFSTIRYLVNIDWGVGFETIDYKNMIITIWYSLMWLWIAFKIKNEILHKELRNE